MMPPEIVIHLSNVTKDFKSGIRGVKVRAIDDVSFSVKKGEIYGLLGPNGCGKSTIMKVILGLTRPNRGKCEILSSSPLNKESRENVGYLPEAPYFPKYLTAREFVRQIAGLSSRRSNEAKLRVDSVLEQVGLLESANRKINTFSKGMLQRLALGQALVHEPEILILDEPTAGVDPQGAFDIAQIILDLKEKGKTVVICSHLLSQMEKVCDRVAIIQSGKILEEGMVCNLLNTEGDGVFEVGGLTPKQVEELETMVKKMGGSFQMKKDANALENLFLKLTDSKK